MDRDQSRFAHIRLSRLSSCCFPQPYKVQVHPASKSLRRSCPDLTSLFLLPFQVPASTSPTISDPLFPAACRQDNHRRNKYSPTFLQLCSQVFLSGASKIPLSTCALLHPSFATEPPTHLFDIFHLASRALHSQLALPPLIHHTLLPAYLDYHIGVTSTLSTLSTTNR
ncbi:hypothetical protein CLIM01_07672 [Colletotrichum limetticola]|uniref:Uncharacterized protein n=1 Tax=Colletotrichum limetticola TaxID=1209924 RepID=A0ABQ9PTY6_9PEZI|nr:hypothetical protein CLIM01_07672 [Colletotrichum limetticola]